MSLHPITTTQRLRETYIRYLKTIKPFQDERLRREFARALEEENMLMKGPFIEITPPFKKGKSIRGLVQEGILSKRFYTLCREDENALSLDRHLYLHQENAIRKVVAGRNIVVTTGTGSGKTEAFLIPILDYLLREEDAGTLDRPGVRALLLYPMNALANDQMDRLRNYLAKYPQITFGRYVGETKHTYKEALDFYKKIHQSKEDPFPDPLPNDLISREQMQKSPPHILLTNYAMLEYLLLRPADSPLFDGETGRHWRFIVLDEAHAYDGAQATEIAMLLRRLQDRVTQGGQKSLQAIATSATLGDESPESLKQIVTFANQLFNLPFEWIANDPTRQDIVLSERIEQSEPGQVWGRGTPTTYATLAKIADTWRIKNRLDIETIKAGLDAIPPRIIREAQQRALETPQEAGPLFLHFIMRGDQRLHDLYSELKEGPALLKDISQKIFPEENIDHAQKALSDLVSAAILTREGKDKAPLLPARYHVFARALEGAFVCLNTNDSIHQGVEAKPTLFLTRQKFCPYCGSRVFELASCTRCGTAYIIGNEKKGSELTDETNSSDIIIDPEGQYLTQSSVIYAHEDIEAHHVNYYILKGESVETDEDALIEGEAGEETGLASHELVPIELCPRCGALYEHGLSSDRCGCNSKTITVYKVDIGRKHSLLRCTSCSTYSKNGVVYRFLTGQDAPVSVLAGALYQDVPPGRKEEDRYRPGNSRKMLIFTDNRQRAAFFAPFIQRVQERQLRRRLMVKSLERNSAEHVIRFSDWLPVIMNIAEKDGVFDEHESLHNKRITVATWLMQEFSGLDKRLSLEGVGLLYFRLYRPSSWHPPQEFSDYPYNLTDEQAFELINILLTTLRRQGAVTYLLADDEGGTGVDLLRERREAFQPRVIPFYIRKQNGEVCSKYGIYSWRPSERFNNSRLDFLIRLMKKRGLTDTDARKYSLALLDRLWDHLTGVSSPGNVWMKSETLSKEGTVYRLRHDRWEVVPTLGEDLRSWYICSQCQNLSPFNLLGVCPTYGCKGELQPLERNKESILDNIYRFQYLNDKPLPMLAIEHTAQWKSDKAAEIQKKFIDGEVNVLSCSTTFELGVDVGDLNAVVLRNVPPSTANYVQRAGRAGRRADNIALVLTFAQRRPHDLTFYDQPKRMISGKIRPPVVTLKNDKIIRRHLHSVVFAAFFRWAKDTLGVEYHNTGEFFDPLDPKYNGPERLQEFIAKRPSELERALLRIIPQDKELREALKLENWQWINFLIGDKDAVLDKVKQEIYGELSEFEKLEKEAANQGNYRLAGEYQQIQNTIRGRELLGYLGSTNVLPKYGFPTDVVQLETAHLNINSAKDIELYRDLRMAISEFAPGGQVIAAGQIWYSRAIRRHPNRLWIPYAYAVCNVCQRMNIQSGNEKPRICTCGQLLDKAKPKGVFIIPEYGFIADSHTDKPGEQPPEQIYASHVYFSHYTTPTDFESKTDVELSPDPDMSKFIRIDKAYTRYAWLAIVNIGHGQGFRVCTKCGYSDVIEPGQSFKKQHRNPLTNQGCIGKMENYHLGHRFMTDVLELSIGKPIIGEKPILSFLYALLGGASDALDIPREDIDGVYYFRGDNKPAFILYDTTPGGSGHVKLIYDHLREALEAAYRRVSECPDCGIDTSCYSCLRSYRNQFVHDKLERRLAWEILALVLGKPRPER